jgi:hypothetical protein
VPARVSNIAPHDGAGVDDPSGLNIGGAQGSRHGFHISSANPKPAPCTGPTDASFDVTVTTPSGSVTSIPFKLSFTCP